MVAGFQVPATYSRRLATRTNNPNACCEATFSEVILRPAADQRFCTRSRFLASTQWRLYPQAALESRGCEAFCAGSSQVAAQVS